MTLLIAVVLLRLGSSVSMVVILLGTLRMVHLVMSYVTEDGGDPSGTMKDGSSHDKFGDCDHGCGYH